MINVGILFLLREEVFPITACLTNNLSVKFMTMFSTLQTTQTMTSSSIGNITPAKTRMVERSHLLDNFEKLLLPSMKLTYQSFKLY